MKETTDYNKYYSTQQGIDKCFATILKCLFIFKTNHTCLFKMMDDTFDNTIKHRFLFLQLFLQKGKQFLHESDFLEPKTCNVHYIF